MSHTNGQPLISTIMPVYNGERYVRAAIESVLNQTYPAQEIILVDDGSTDSTARIVDEFVPQLRYCSKPNGGTASARNFGVKLAKGQYLAFLDHDDLWTRNKLAIQVAAFQSDPELDMVFGHLQQFQSPELDFATKCKLHCEPKPLPGLLPSTMMIKKEAFYQIGLFDNRWNLGEWPDWYLQAVESDLRIRLLPEVLAQRRLHEHNKGTVKRRFLKEYPRMLKESLDRRRANTR